MYRGYFHVSSISLNAKLLQKLRNFLIDLSNKGGGNAAQSIRRRRWRFRNQLFDRQECSSKQNFLHVLNLLKIDISNLIDLKKNILTFKSSNQVKFHSVYIVQPIWTHILILKFKNGYVAFPNCHNLDRRSSVKNFWADYEQFLRAVFSCLNGPNSF